MTGGVTSASLAALWDWRRQIADLYAAVRAEPDAERAWLHWRRVRDELFRDHAQSPIDPGAGFAGLDFFPYDPALRFHMEQSPIPNGVEESFVAGEDGELRMLPFARSQGLQETLGGELTFYWLLGYGGGVFVPFADKTSGRETYGAGRYLLDTIKSADLGAAPDGRVLLDFNFAYNPSCAYSTRFVCPLAPAANRLPAAVRVGERTPGSSG